MLEELIGAAVRAQSRNLKRKATGAVVEAAALGLVGFALLFALIAIYLWLSTKVEAWVAALIVATVVLVLAIILFLVGRMMMARNSRNRRAQIDEALGEFRPLAQALTGDAGLSRKSSAGIVAAALAAGIVLGRSLHR